MFRKIFRKSSHSIFSRYWVYLVVYKLQKVLIFDNFSTKHSNIIFCIYYIYFLSISLMSLFLLITFDVCFVFFFLTTCLGSNAGNKSLLRKLPIMTLSYIYVYRLVYMYCFQGYNEGLTSYVVLDDDFE